MNLPIDLLAASMAECRNELRILDNILSEIEAVPVYILMADLVCGSDFVLGFHGAKTIAWKKIIAVKPPEFFNGSLLTFVGEKGKRAAFNLRACYRKQDALCRVVDRGDYLAHHRDLLRADFLAWPDTISQHAAG